ncbi:MAG: hydroxyacid dehydrogenase [Rhodobacteraceae bacterium]|nr:hydroxyacid dehydrogenase [Paracoccaceae bacterium]
MARARVLVCEFIDEAALANAPEDVVIDYQPNLAADRAALLAALTDVDGLVVRNLTKVDDALLAAAPSLVAIGRIGVGLENFDLAACAARGVAVFPATGANAVSVAEYVFATALRLLRGDLRGNDALCAGAWPREAMIMGEIAGRSMAIIGLGHCGGAVARRARAFDMRVLAVDPYLPASAAAWTGVERVELDQALAEADVLSLHAPLTDETRHLINPAALARMKPGSILINSARGPVIDLAAVAAALRCGRLGGAAIDVYPEEPLTAEAASVFDGAPNLLLTPHIAGVTRESNRRVSILAVTQTLSELRRRRA